MHYEWNGLFVCGCRYMYTCYMAYQGSAIFSIWKEIASTVGQISWQCASGDDYGDTCRVLPSKYRFCRYIPWHLRTDRLCQCVNRSPMEKEYIFINRRGNNHIHVHDKDYMNGICLVISRLASRIIHKYSGFIWLPFTAESRSKCAIRCEWLLSIHLLL